MDLAPLGDHDRFARHHVAQEFVSQHVERHALGGHHIVDAGFGLALAVDQRPDAVGIAEGDDAVARDHGHGRIGATGPPVHAGHGAEDVLLVDAQLAELLQLVGEDVEQHLGIRVRVDVALVFPEQGLTQGFRVGEIAVVSQADAVGGIHIEGLGLGTALAARRGVADMTDAHAAAQVQHVTLGEDVTHQAVVLAQIETVPVTGHDARGILPAMLQDGQAVVQRLIDGFVRYDSDDPTHVTLPIGVGCFRPRPPAATRASIRPPARRRA